jgi:acetolactate synthase-1/2/3 large subunit
VRLLERQGVRTLAGIPGGAILPIYDALSKSTLIHHVLARHEQGGGFMAQGMARVHRRAGGMHGVFGSRGDQPADGDRRCQAGFDSAGGDHRPGAEGDDRYRRLSGSRHLRSEHPDHQAQLPGQLGRGSAGQVVPRAFRIAASGRPGPVLVDIPKDVQNQLVEVGEWPPAGRADRIPPPAAELVERRRGDDQRGRPGRFSTSAAVSCIRALPHRRGAGREGRSADRDDPDGARRDAGRSRSLSLGMLGMHGARCTNLALDECDLLIAVGARFDDRATGKVAGFCPQAKIVHIDIDPSELDKIKTAHVGIAGDVGPCCRCLLPAVESPQREAWLARVASLKAAHPLRMPGVDDPRTPYGLIRAVADCLDDEATITTDVGQHQMWVAQAYPLRRPRQWLTSGGLGTMGFGMPAAIGAALAEPERTVVCFTGDGSILMNIQELVTAAEENVNVKIVLMNNSSLGLVFQQQTMFYGERIYASKFKGMPDFIRVAEGFGVPAIDLDAESDPRAALAAALSAAARC